MTLHTLHTGIAGPRIAFLHGLFGQGRNWMSVAKALAGPDHTGARALLVDLPNHGRSPWTQEFSFADYAQQVVDTLAAQAPGERWTLVGHSLGGKTAMYAALAHPQIIERLAVVDIAPKTYGHLHRFAEYVRAMKDLPLEEIHTRAEADRAFASAEPSPAVRAFLLQNLRRDKGHWRWQANLDLVLADAARGAEARMGSWPDDAAAYSPYDGPVLLLAGDESPYVEEGDADAMRELFPKTVQLTIKGAGHWTHTDAPEVVIEALARFIAE